MLSAWPPTRSNATSGRRTVVPSSTCSSSMAGDGSVSNSNGLTAPALTRSMHSALTDLRLSALTVIHSGNETFPLAPRVRAVAARRLLEDLR